MESIRCNFCGADQPEKRYELRDWMTGAAQPFTLVCCRVCGLLYLNPRPTISELPEFYPQKYAPYRVPMERTLTGRLASRLQEWVWRRRSGWIKRYSGLAGGELLDVGCANGDFIFGMQHSGQWHCQGIEISPEVAAVARSRTGAEIIEKDMLEARLPTAFYDLITFWDVLEHLPKPYEVLQTAYQSLKPGGWLVIRVPDPGSLSARLFKQDWVNHDPPRHFYAFPRELLITRLDQIGFDEINFHYLTGDYFAFTMSLSIYFSRMHSPLLAGFFKQLSQFAIWRFITIPLFIIPAWLKMSASIIYLAHKPVHN